MFKKKITIITTIISVILTITSCGNTTSSKEHTNTTISYSDSSVAEEINTSSDVSSTEEVDSTEDSSDVDSTDESSETDSSEDESSKAVTTTKTILKETAKATTTKVYKETAKATTTTKQTTTQPAVTTKPYVAPTTQKPVVTTKTTTKQTTKATTKATTKITTSKIVKPSNLTRYEDALWEVMVNKNYSKTNTKYLEIIRQEAIKYAQNGWIKQYYDAVGGFEVNSKMYPFVKNGKPYYVYEKGIVNALVEFDDMNPMGGCDTSSTEAAMSEVKAEIHCLDVMIAHQLANACRHGEPDIQWNLTYGLITEDGFTSIEWYCITGFASTWK